MSAFMAASITVFVLTAGVIAAWGWFAWRGVRSTLQSLASFENMHLDR